MIVHCKSRIETKVKMILDRHLRQTMAVDGSGDKEEDETGQHTTPRNEAYGLCVESCLCLNDGRLVDAKCCWFW